MLDDDFVALRDRGDLLPTQEDIDLLEQDAALDLARAILAGVPDWLADARAHPNEERSYELPGGASVLLWVVPPKGGVTEVWAALPTLLAPVLGFTAETRDLVLAVITKELGGQSVEWEQRYGLPSGRDLKEYEVAYFWVA